MQLEQEVIYSWGWRVLLSFIVLRGKCSTMRHTKQMWVLCFFIVRPLIYEVQTLVFAAIRHLFIFQELI